MGHLIGPRRAVKRLMDLVVAGTALVVLSPVLVAVALAVAIRQGRPILFRQQRPGLGGKLFTIYKFRTMRVPRAGEVYYLTDNERITRLGKFLRATSLDEAAVNALVMGEIVYLFNSRRLTDSALSLDALLGNRVALVATGVLVLLQLAFTYLTPMQTLFGTGAMSAAAWGLVLAFGVAMFFVIEIEKAVTRALRR